MSTPEIELGKTALSLASGQIAKLLEEARLKRLDDVSRVEAHLKICAMVVDGLEREYDEILVAAAHLGPESEAAKALGARIDTYLHVDALRPQLALAIAGLEEYRDIFEARSQDFLTWPWRRGNRAVAARTFGRVVGILRDYLDELAQHGLQHRHVGTGLWAEQLNRLQATIGAGLVDVPAVAELAREFQHARERDTTFALLTRIQKTIEEVRQQFS